MFDTRIEIMAYSQERDDYNERTMELVQIGVFYAQKTESGGRENLYASRIVHENEVVFTVRYSDKIKSGMFVRLDGRDMKITSVHEEGHRKYLHLKTIKSENQS
jgi:SPP1 family predicted phage head-tail adaptor